MLKKIRNYIIYLIYRTKIKMKLFVVTILPEKKEKIQRYPKVIQLPITYKCNFDCVMCGMRNFINKKDFTYEELDKILSDKLFKKITSVGLNGGEPFLKKDLVDCISVIINRLNNLKEINIISNGFFTDSILNTLEKIKKNSEEKNIKINVSFSVDGVNEMQDFMRGTKQSWINVNKTIDAIRKNQNKYCDSVGIICTITKHNIYNIEEVEAWAIEKKLNVAYNIATENARIDNYNKVSDFTIFNDEDARMCAQEFFYKKFLQEKSKRYFGIYLFIRENKRYAPCDCQKNLWVTLTPDSQISYCATHSKELGNALEESAYNIFNSNLPYLKEIIAKKCDRCSHYIYTLSKEGRKKYYKELLKF